MTDGANQTFTITPEEGYEIADVLVDGVSVGAVTGYTFTDVQANHTISVTFKEPEAVTHTITATAGSNGTITPSGVVSVTDGANQSFTITPSAGYEVADVLVDGVSVGARNTYTFTDVTKSHTISASFKPAFQEGRVTITPANITVYEGGDGGYDAVVGDTGTTTSNSLPHPMFRIDTPDKPSKYQCHCWR